MRAAGLLLAEDTLHMLHPSTPSFTPISNLHTSDADYEFTKVASRIILV